MTQWLSSNFMAPRKIVTKLEYKVWVDSCNYNWEQLIDVSRWAISVIHPNLFILAHEIDAAYGSVVKFVGFLFPKSDCYISALNDYVLPDVSSSKPSYGK